MTKLTVSSLLSFVALTQLVKRPAKKTDDTVAFVAWSLSVLSQGLHIASVLGLEGQTESGRGPSDEILRRPNAGVALSYAEERTASEVPKGAGTRDGRGVGTGTTKNNRRFRRS